MSVSESAGKKIGNIEVDLCRWKDEKTYADMRMYDKRDGEHTVEHRVV